MGFLKNQKNKEELIEKRFEIIEGILDNLILENYLQQKKIKEMSENGRKHK